MAFSTGTHEFIYCLSAPDDNDLVIPATAKDVVVLKDFSLEPTVAEDFANADLGRFDLGCTCQKKPISSSSALLSTIRRRLAGASSEESGELSFALGGLILNSNRCVVAQPSDIWRALWRSVK